MITGFTAVGIMDVLLDVIILLLPIRMVWQLQIPFANKTGLASLFALGIVYVNQLYSDMLHMANLDTIRSTIITGILRIIAVHDVDLTDISYNMAKADVFCIIEISIAIIISSTAIMRPLFDRIFQPISSLIKSTKVVSSKEDGLKARQSVFSGRFDHIWKESEGCELSLKQTKGVDVQISGGPDALSSGDEVDVEASTSLKGNHIYVKTTVAQ